MEFCCNWSCLVALIITSRPHACPCLQYKRLMQGALIRRYKRFLADVDFHSVPVASGGTDASAPTVVHCPNTGPMTGLLDRCWALALFELLGMRCDLLPVIHSLHSVSALTYSLCLFFRHRAPVLCSIHDGKTRKYAHTLEAIQPGPGNVWVRYSYVLSSNVSILPPLHLQVCSIVTLKPTYPPACRSVFTVLWRTRWCTASLSPGRCRR